MNIKNREKLLSKNKFNIWYSPEVIAPGYEDSDRRLVELLVWYKGFHDAINKIRNVIDLPDIFPFPSETSAIELIKILHKISLDKRRILEDEVFKLIEKYQLTTNWRLSIKMAVLTNTILIPAKEKIKVNLPEHLHPLPEEDETGLRDFVKQKRAMEMAKYPGIYFTRKVSVKGFKRWIDENKILFEEMQSKLPDKINIKRYENTLFWGQVAWIFKQDGINSWSKMIDKLTESFGYKGTKDEIEKSSEDPTEKIPDQVELRKCYDRFLDSIHSIKTS